MVKQSAQNPKFKRSNPANAGTERKQLKSRVALG
jgi:hypothetical protein